MTPLLILETSYWGLFSVTRQLAEATLIAVGAIAIGYVVRRKWPATLRPVLFGSLAVVTVVPGLAYAGVGSAGIVLWMFIAAAVVLGALALVLN